MERSSKPPSTWTLADIQTIRYDPFTVPSLKLRQNDLLLAPMAELSHDGFRRLVADFGGCDWYFTEMLSAAAVHSTSPYSK